MKLEEKRINNDNFEQVEKCIDCGDLFWSVSEFELGNWKRICKNCELAREKAEEVKIDREQNKTFNGAPIRVTNIDDYIMEAKSKGIKTIVWSEEELMLLAKFIQSSGFPVFFYMGVNHQFR